LFVRYRASRYLSAMGTPAFGPSVTAKEAGSAADKTPQIACAIALLGEAHVARRSGARRDSEQDRGHQKDCAFRRATPSAQRG